MSKNVPPNDNLLYVYMCAADTWARNELLAGVNCHSATNYSFCIIYVCLVGTNIGKHRYEKSLRSRTSLS